MALEVNFSLLFSKNCGSTTFGDDTPEGATGYGGSNPEKADITSTKITFTQDGVNYVYESYLPTTASISLTPSSFTPPIATVAVEDDDDCGCSDCDEEEVEASTDTYPDKCWVVKYEVFIDDELISSRSEDYFFDCLFMNRWIADMRSGLCGGCDQEKQDALREAEQLHQEALLVYKHAGCECAGNLLDKANEILEDVENDAL